MTRDSDYDAYVSALVTAIDLPNAHATRVDGIERQSRDEIAQLDRKRHEDARRWTELRDTCSRLSRRVNDLAGRVGSPPGGRVDAKPLAVSAIPASLESLRTDLEKAEQSWQWVQRHRERVRQMAQPVSAQAVPVVAPQPSSAPAPPPARAGGNINPAVLIAVAAVVIVVLVIVIVAMAL